MERVDLHVHTTASDGLMTPAELINEAKKMNIKALGITDHDTLEGVPEALNAGRDKGVEIVPGIEISTAYKEKEIHILGYFVSSDYKPLKSLIEKIKNERLHRMEKMIARLNNLGINVNINEVIKIGSEGSLGRPHLGIVMLQKGYVNSVKEAFEKYIGLGRPAYIERFKVSPSKVIHLIRGAGGVPVLAHPGISGEDQLIPALSKEGLLGLEVFHPQHRWPMYIKYWNLAHQNKLAITGGSDFHGRTVGTAPILGAVTISYSYLSKLKKEAKRARETVSKFL